MLQGLLWLLKTHVFRPTSIKHYNNRVDVLGRKYVFDPSQSHFSPRRFNFRGHLEKESKTVSDIYLEHCRRRVDVYFILKHRLENARALIG